MPTLLTDPRRGPLVAIVAIVLVAGTSAAYYAVEALAAEESPGFVVTNAHDHGGHDHGTHDHARAGLPGFGCPEDAKIPDLFSPLDRVGAIQIRGDAGFTPAAGIRSGSGTATDPFVISGLKVPALQLSDTTAYFLVVGNDIGTLVLDWNGKGGLVCKNHISDLRVNRNVDRVEAPTAGIIEGNRIDKVGQIRHFDGIFRSNEVGTATSRGVVLNVDGMNAADFAENVIRGGVDMKLHGHHHGEPGESHMHVAPKTNASDGYDGVDHTDRLILFRFHDNSIEDLSGFGLRYNDRNHAGDDRTATSETTLALEKPHVHRTTVLIENNTVRRAPLRVEVFNSADERHLPGQHGMVIVRNNVVTDIVSGSGMIVSAVADADVLIVGNRIARASLAGLPLALGTGAGIELASFKNASLAILTNSVSGFTYGVRARDFDAGTTWTVGKNSVTGARTDVYWDETVAHAPSR